MCRYTTTKMILLELQMVCDPAVEEHLLLRIRFAWGQMAKHLCLPYLTNEATDMSLSALYGFTQL